MATYTTNYNLGKPEATDPFGDFRQLFNDNMDEIDANLGGGGSSSLAGLSDVNISAPTDGQVLTYDNVNSEWVNANPSGGGDVMDVEVNGVSVVDLNKVAKITSYKEVTQAQYDALPATKLTDGIAYFIKDGGGSGSGSSFLLVITAETGETVTATKGATTLTATETSTGIYEVTITEPGTWTLTDGSNTTTVDVGVYTATLSSVPEGSTVTPTDDVSIWLACGGRTENYTTIGEVLSDSTCLLALLSDNNANDYLVRSTTWASTITANSSAMTYIGLDNYCANTLLADATWCNAICNSEYFESVLNVKVPVMTSDTTPEGECFGDGIQPSYPAWRAFDNDPSTFGYTSSITGYIGYMFENKVRVCALSLTKRAYNSWASTIKVQGTDDKATFTDVSPILNNTESSGATTHFTFVNSTSYKGYVVKGLTSSVSAYFNAAEIQFYGRKDV